MGLPENITASWEIIHSTETIKNLQHIQHEEILVNQNFSREIWKNKLIPLLNLWKNLNIENNLTNKLKIIEEGNDPFIRFIKSEYEYAEILVNFLLFFKFDF